MTDSDNFLRPVLISQPQDNQSWQRTELGIGGRYAGRDYYYDGVTAEPGADHSKPTTPTAEFTGRSLRIIGLVIALAGAAAWLALILTVVSELGKGTLPDDPFSGRFAGIPLGTGGLVAILVGSVLGAIGSWVSRSARERRTRPFWIP